MRARWAWALLTLACAAACSVLFDDGPLTGGARDAGVGGASPEASTETGAGAGAAGSSDAATEAETSAPDAAGCSPDQSPCNDDGNPCTRDVCQNGACAHLPAVGTPCSATGVCDATLACRDGCGIDGAFYAPGAENPADACEVCDPQTSRTSFSTRPDQTPCNDDMNACTDDLCRSGVCLHVPHPPGSSCGTGEVCDDTGQCSAGCFTFDAGFVADGTVDPLDPCRACDASQSTNAWSVRADGSTCTDDNNPCTKDTCQGGKCSHSLVLNMPCGNGGTCTVFIGRCSAQCSIGGSKYPEGTLNPANPCESCQTKISASAWTPIADGTSCGSTSCAAYNGCTFADDCSLYGARVRPCTTNVCTAGKCVTATANQSRPCARQTDGSACTDDGSACTTDTCAGGTCIHPDAAPGSACTGGICDGNGACKAGCYVDRAFYDDGAENPVDACQRCDAASSTSSWTPAACE